ncbi:MAG TPA: aminotransferase class V-fold PLP-dependent enzyme, partial [Gemmataceae bacterium]|nr:aminotransferase class V-fold PLP-dependent enzyme [Gemmataceae bacterium]
MVNLPIYLDNNATTRVDPRVVEAMLPYFTENYGNAASRHHVFGQEAEKAVEAARGQVASHFNAAPREIVFTSGATESDNLAIKGVAAMHRVRGDHVITAATEHHAVLDPCKRLERDGIRVTILPVDAFGRISAEQVAAALTESTILVSIMTANNEIGTLQPVAAIGKLCKERGVLFHTDAAQAAGNLALDVEAMGIDLLSISAHKMYGPKGVGALYVRRRDPHVRLEPMLDGGGHERGLRSGTLPVPLIVAFGKACELCRLEMAQEAKRLTALREELRASIMDQLEEVYLNGHPTERLPGNLNLSFACVQGEALLMGLRNIAVSSGSACTSAQPEPSYV